MCKSYDYSQYARDIRMLSRCHMAYWLSLLRCAVFPGCFSKGARKFYRVFFAQLAAFGIKLCRLCIIAIRDCVYRSPVLFACLARSLVHPSFFTCVITSLCTSCHWLCPGCLTCTRGREECLCIVEGHRRRQLGLLITWPTQPRLHLGQVLGDTMGGCLTDLSTLFLLPLR